MLQSNFDEIVEKYVELILAGASVDDVFVIVIFTAPTSLASAGAVSIMSMGATIKQKYDVLASFYGIAMWKYSFDSRRTCYLNNCTIWSNLC